MNMAPRIDVDSSWLLSIIDEINRARALNDNEVAIVERIISVKTNRERRTFRWTAKLDRKLLAMSAERGGIRAFAKQNNISPHAAHMRLCRIRENVK